MVGLYFTIKRKLYVCVAMLQQSKFIGEEDTGGRPVSFVKDFTYIGFNFTKHIPSNYGPLMLMKFARVEA